MHKSGHSRKLTSENDASPSLSSSNHYTRTMTTEMKAILEEKYQVSDRTSIVSFLTFVMLYLSWGPVSVRNPVTQSRTETDPQLRYNSYINIAILPGKVPLLTKTNCLLWEHDYEHYKVIFRINNSTDALQYDIGMVS